MHYYQFNIGDWALHTSHLTLEEEAVYRRLLDFYYDTELPIPKETQPVIRRLRLGNYVNEFDQVLSEFFTKEDDGWHNYRADIEIKAFHDKANSARANGKKGGRPRKNKGLKTQPVILANPEVTQPKPDAKLTKNYKLETNNEELSKTLDQSAIDQDALFDQLWASGIRKVNKKKSKSIFDRIVKSQPDPILFTNNLCSDVQKRIESGQLGFTEMHPTTYLNGERWNDDIQQPQPISGNQKPLSASERVRQAISEKQAARSAGGSSGGDFSGQAMADAGGYVRPQTGEPVRGDSTGCVGEVLEGDFWPANSGRP